MVPEGVGLECPRRREQILGPEEESRIRLSDFRSRLAYSEVLDDGFLDCMIA
jgi:hypothetical protein